MQPTLKIRNTLGQVGWMAFRDACDRVDKYRDLGFYVRSIKVWHFELVITELSRKRPAPPVVEDQSNEDTD